MAASQRYSSACVRQSRGICLCAVLSYLTEVFNLLHYTRTDSMIKYLVACSPFFWICQDEIKPKN